MINTDIIPELNNKDYIDKLTEKYDIGFCPIDKVEDLVLFIDKYWKKDHIFVLSRKLLDWQHLDKKNNRYNFVIATDKNTKEIHSILGFVTTSQYDDKINNTLAWACIWKVRDEISVKGLGVSLYHYLKCNLKPETLCVLGISKETVGIYQKWNFKTGEMNHYYILNDSLNDYKILKNYENIPKCFDSPANTDKTFKKCNKDEFKKLDYGSFTSKNIYKSKDYYINRFFEHPMYKYEAVAIYSEDIVIGVLFYRISEYNNAKALRIVDYIGKADTLIGCIDCFKEIILEYNAEYIDVINFGITNEVFNKAGFMNKADGDLIIPNYFEPFVLENIPLEYAFKTISKDSECIFFKADADQDRPSMLKE